MGSRRRSNSDRSGKSSREFPRTKLRRRPGSVYTFTQHHFDLVDEVHRLFPDQEKLLDFSDIEPGLESVELISNRLLESFSSTLAHGVFLVFGKINAPRVLHYISDRVEEEAWPLEPNHVLADVYAQLFHHFRGRAGHGWPARGDGPFAAPLTKGRTTYRMLVEAAELVMADRIREFQSMTAPLPGVPIASTAPPPGTVETAAEIVSEHGWKLTPEELRGWVSFALLRMDREDRRVVHLRDMRRLDLRELADVIGCSAFEAGQRVKAAHEQLRSQLLRLIRVFSTEQDRDVPGPGSSGPRGSERQRGDEDESDV